MVLAIGGSDHLSGSKHTSAIRAFHYDDDQKWKRVMPFASCYVDTLLLSEGL